MNPKIVVFTQTYNAANTLRRAIDSILNQTWGDFEYYILDNGSTDNTEDIIYEYVGTDNRIKPLRININDTTIGGPFFTMLSYSTNAKYISWLDADDEYTPDFFNEMIRFAEENHLDIASCGYQKIDGNSGDIVKHRMLEENLILSDSLFADEFIKYRGFTTYLWGKLYSIDFFRANKLSLAEKVNRICNDSIWVLSLFKKAERAGVYGKAMYKYYQYPRSLSRSNIQKSMSSYSDYWNETKKYIESFGPISKLNEDFLYAIHLSLVSEAADNVLISDLSSVVKLSLLAQLFGDPVWAETMTRDADPQFRNLAARSEFVSEMKNRILALPGADARSTSEIIKCLELKSIT